MSKLSLPQSGQIWSGGEHWMDVLIFENRSGKLKAVFDDGSLLQCNGKPLTDVLMEYGYKYAGRCASFRVKEIDQ